MSAAATCGRRRLLAAVLQVQPVRSMCVSTAGEVVDTGRKSLGPPRHPRRAVVGSGTDRRRSHHRRLCHRRRIGQSRTHQRFCRPVRHRLYRRGPCGPAVGHLHRRGPTTVDPVHRGAGLLLPVAPVGHPRHQGHPDQLRLSAHRTIPADVHDIGDRAVAGHGAVVLRRERQDGDHQARQVHRQACGGRRTADRGQGQVVGTDRDGTAHRGRRIAQARRRPNRHRTTSVTVPTTHRPTGARPITPRPTNSRHGRSRRHPAAAAPTADPRPRPGRGAGEPRRPTPSSASPETAA